MLDLNKNGRNDFKDLFDWFKGLFDFNDDGKVNFEDFTFIMCKGIDELGDKDGRVEVADVLILMSKAGVDVKYVSLIKELAFIFGDGKLSISDTVALWHLVEKIKNNK